MKVIARIVLIAGLAAVPSSCQTLSGNPSITQLSASLKTGLLAGDLGAALDDKTRKLAASAEYRALEGGVAGAPVNWKASNTLFGSVVPQQSFSVGATNCRRYVHSISQDGVLRSASATACRSEDGMWLPIS